MFQIYIRELFACLRTDADAYTDGRILMRTSKVVNFA